MAERTNGNITIVAGLPDMPGPIPDARLSTNSKQILAFRLRKQGWSYRRISDALGISYATVLVWLEEEAPVAAPVVLRDPLPIPPRVSPVRPPANVSAPFVSAPLRPPTHESASETVLQGRLDAIIAEQQAQAQALAGLEEKLMASLRQEMAGWGKRILDAIKNTSKSVKSR